MVFPAVTLGYLALLSLLYTALALVSDGARAPIPGPGKPLPPDRAPPLIGSSALPTPIDGA